MQYKYNWQLIFFPSGKLIANIITLCAVFYCRTGCCLLLLTSLSFCILDFGSHVYLDMSHRPYKLSPCLSFLDNSTLWLKTSLLSYCDRPTSKMASKWSPKHCYLYPCIIPSYTLGLDLVSWFYGRKKTMINLIRTRLWSGTEDRWDATSMIFKDSNFCLTSKLSLLPSGLNIWWSKPPCDKEVKAASS